MIAPHPADTAAKDGRVIRGWFRFPGGARMVAVSWRDEKQGWVDLRGQSRVLPRARNSVDPRVQPDRFEP
jgi:hypothetical protein